MDTQLRTQTPRTRRGAEASATGLSVQVSWGDRLLAAQVLSAAGTRRFSVGSGGGHDFASGRGGAVVFSVGEAGPLFGFSNGLTGEVWRNGETALGLSEVVRCGLAEEGDALWEMPLGRTDTIRLELGALTVEAVPVRAPRRVTGARALDYRWLNVLLATALLASLVVVRAVVTNLERLGDDGPPASTELTRYRRVLVKQAEPVRAPRAPAAVEVPVKVQPGRVVAASGRPMPIAAPPREGGGSPNAPRPNALALVGTLLRGLGDGNVFGQGGLGTTLNQALGTVVAAKVDGLGGLGLKGTGTGGLITGPARLGGIGLISRPGGYGDPTLRPGPKPGPVIEPGDQVVGCTPDGRGAGCLDRETIRRIIRQHVSQLRYCYESQLQLAPTLGGKVSVRFHVAPSGAVDQATVLESTVGRVELGRCVVGRVRTWVFPGMPHGYTVSYPFLFKPSGS